MNKETNPVMAISINDPLYLEKQFDIYWDSCFKDVSKTGCQYKETKQAWFAAGMSIINLLHRIAIEVPDGEVGEINGEKILKALETNILTNCIIIAAQSQIQYKHRN